MDHDNLDRNPFLNSFIKDVFRASNKEYQERVWIEGKGPECDDFDETADFIIGHGEIILKNYKDYGITENQYFLTKKFWEEFDKFAHSIGRDYLPGDFIDTPEWTKITEMAKEVLKAFHWKMHAHDGEN